MVPVAGDGSVLSGGRGRLFRQVVDRRFRPVGRRWVDRISVIRVAGQVPPGVADTRWRVLILAASGCRCVPSTWSSSSSCQWIAGSRWRSQGVATASDGGFHLVASWPGGGHCGATCDHIGATNSPYEGIVALLWPVWSVRGLSVVSRRPAGDYAHGDSLPGGLQLAVLWPEGDHRGDAGLVVVS